MEENKKRTTHEEEKEKAGIFMRLNCLSLETLRRIEDLLRKDAIERQRNKVNAD